MNREWWILFVRSNRARFIRWRPQAVTCWFARSLLKLGNSSKRRAENKTFIGSKNTLEIVHEKSGGGLLLSCRQPFYFCSPAGCSRQVSVKCSSREHRRRPLPSRIPVTAGREVCGKRSTMRASPPKLRTRLASTSGHRSAALLTSASILTAVIKDPSSTPSHRTIHAMLTRV